MKNKLTPVAYPIIAACICFIIGIVMFSVALALKWGTTCATLQLYAWLNLAGICAVLAVILQYCRDGGQAGSSDSQGDYGGQEEILQDCQKSLGDVKSTLAEVSTTISRSYELLTDVHAALYGVEEVSEETKE